MVLVLAPRGFSSGTPVDVPLIIPIYLFMYLYSFISIYLMSVGRMRVELQVASCSCELQVAVARVKKVWIQRDCTGAMINCFGSIVGAILLIPSSIHALEAHFLKMCKPQQDLFQFHLQQTFLLGLL